VPSSLLGHGHQDGRPVELDVLGFPLKRPPVRQSDRQHEVAALSEGQNNRHTSSFIALSFEVGNKDISE
jgi:hypothetical protein